MKDNFVRDSLPPQFFEALEIPSALYKDQRDEEAIAAYKKVIEAHKASAEPEVATRGRQEMALTEFLADYYMGQSYLSASRAKEAIPELESALEGSPDAYWKSKAA